MVSGDRAIGNLFENLFRIESNSESCIGHHDSIIRPVPHCHGLLPANPFFAANLVHDLRLQMGIDNPSLDPSSQPASSDFELVPKGIVESQPLFQNISEVTEPSADQSHFESHLFQGRDEFFAPLCQLKCSGQRF